MPNHKKSLSEPPASHWGLAPASLLTAILAFNNGAAFATPIPPPPRPPGSAQVVIVAGEPTSEIDKKTHGHHHEGHIKKDKTKDDSLDKPKSVVGSPS